MSWIATCEPWNDSNWPIIDVVQLWRSHGMEIGSLLNQAGGASAIAQHLGVDESTVEKGASALLPHVANGVETQGLPPAEAGSAEPAHGGGLGGMLGGLIGGSPGGGGMGAGGVTGGILGSLIGGGVGNQILGHIFGSKDTSRDVATQASQESGVDPSVLKKLLPIVAGAVAVYYMSHRGQGGATADAGSSGGGAGAPHGGILGSLLRFQR
jgi:hypothetical protein